MSRAWLLGIGLAFAACLNIEEAEPRTEAGGGTGGGGAAQSDAGPDVVSGGSWNADSSLEAAVEAASDAAVDTSGGGGCSPDNPLLLDDFGSPDGPLGSAWTGDVGSFAVQGGQLRHTKAGLDDRILNSKKLCAKQTASVRLMKVDPSSGLVGVMFAATSNKDCNLIQVGHSGAQNGISVAKCWNGKWSTHMSTPWPVFDGDRIEARLTEAGLLTVLVNAEVVGSVNVGTFPPSQPGIALFAAGIGVVLDDFKGG